MANTVVPIVRPVTTPTLTIPRVLVVPVASFPLNTFKRPSKRVQIAPAADIHRLLVSPVQWVAMLVRLGSIPTKKEWPKKPCARNV
jgi:hypothetical protein